MLCVSTENADKSFKRIEELHAIAPGYYPGVVIRHHPKCSNVIEDLHDQGITVGDAMARCHMDCILAAPNKQFMAPLKKIKGA